LGVSTGFTGDPDSKFKGIESTKIQIVSSPSSKNDESIGYSGLMRCGNVWGYPICCAKVMRRRGEQIGKLFNAVHKDGAVQ
jgi:hypothetical protein